MQSNAAQIEAMRAGRLHVAGFSTGPTAFAVNIAGAVPFAIKGWDINVRESGVLGLVGAGGIGMVLDTALNLFQWPRVAMVLVSVFAVVIAAEVLVTQARKRIL